jgi:hypothetical protein
VNPLYTPRELGTSSRILAQAIVIIDFAHARMHRQHAHQACRACCAMGTSWNLLRALVNYVVLTSENGASVCPNACSFNDAVSKGQW